MSIPFTVRQALHDDIWQRADSSAADEILRNLRVPDSATFFEFFTTFAGPFGSKSFGHELLDLYEQKESIATNTEAVRSEFGFPNRYLVVSNLLGHSVLVYDIESEKVYDVDFEGGDQMLLKGSLNPSWNSWEEFLCEYFG